MGSHVGRDGAWLAGPVLQPRAQLDSTSSTAAQVREVEEASEEDDTYYITILWTYVRDGKTGHRSWSEGGAGGERGRRP